MKGKAKRLSTRAVQTSGISLSLILGLFPNHSPCLMSQGSTVAKSANPDLSKGKTFVKALQALPSDHYSKVDKPRGSVRVFYQFTVSTFVIIDL